MDSSLISSVHLIEDWIERIMEDYEQEVEETSGSGSWSMKILVREGRMAIWNLCNVLHVDKYGVPGQACRLLERVLYEEMRERLRTRALDHEEWQAYKRSMAHRIPLLMASCVQLAAKMSCLGLQVNPKLIRACLLTKGVSFSVDEIKQSEFHVFSMLGFRLPLWTSLEMAQMLAVEMGLPKSALEAVVHVADIAEYHRDQITASVRNVATSSTTKTFNADSLGTPHLAAGLVAATARYLDCEPTDLLPRLAELMRAPTAYIRCISDVITAILTQPTQDTADNRRCLKRKNTDDKSWTIKNIRSQ